MIVQAMTDQLITEMRTQTETQLLEVFKQIYVGGAIVLPATVFAIIAWLCYSEWHKAVGDETLDPNKPARVSPAARLYEDIASIWTSPKWHRHTSAR